MRTIMLAAVLTALAAPVFAATPWTATPVQPSTKTGFVADAVIWSCDTAGCKATSDTSEASDNHECRSLAHLVGPLSSFTGNTTFSAAKLTECNGSAPKPKA